MLLGNIDFLFNVIQGNAPDVSRYIWKCERYEEKAVSSEGSGKWNTT